MAAIAHNPQQRMIGGFCKSAGVILGITALGKTVTVFGNAGLLTAFDPIFGISIGRLLLIVGVVELVIAVNSFFSRRYILSAGLVAWLATNFVVYRIGLGWIDWEMPCNCLGNLTDALHVSPQLADNIMKGVLAYLLIGSYGLLFWEWRSQKRKAGNRESGNKIVGVAAEAESP